jgi:hypothetical protein
LLNTKIRLFCMLSKAPNYNKMDFGLVPPEHMFYNE